MNEEERNNLYDDYCDTKNTIKLDVSQVDTGKKKLALQFQRKLPELSEEEWKSISEILGEEDN